uniref:Uncharacterized protein n=1 Tax=Arundo donax TaxID=35708 RepID=A0A0A9CQ12_ARUDO
MNKTSTQTHQTLRPGGSNRWDVPSNRW